MIDVSLLRCPKTGEKLELKGNKLISIKSKIEYIVKDDIPVLLEIGTY